MYSKKFQDIINQAIVEEQYYSAGCNGYPSLRHDFDKLKFSELIVEECFKAAMIEFKGHMNPNDLMQLMKHRVGI